jgi:predicted TIM-barrel fold metal-dependent hydrolase
MPPGATDCHAHIYGGQGHYASIAAPNKLPPSAGLATYRAMMKATGLSRVVVVQPDYYGFDNSALLDALAGLGGAGRGVCAVPAEAGQALLSDLDAAGVRGIRLTDLSGHCLGLSALPEAGRMAAGLGWHLSLLVDPGHLEPIGAVVKALPCPVLIDHLARFRPGVSAPTGFEALLRLAELPNVWVKLSAVEFLSRQAPGYSDLDPFVARLASVTDRLLWGTDWPHGSVTFTGAPMPDDGGLLELLARWFPDAGERQRILADDPARLYGFQTERRGAA